MESRPVLYVLRSFPTLTETFVLNEMLALEAAGVPVAIESLRPSELGPALPALSKVRAPVRQLSEFRGGRRALARAHLSLLAAHPGRWVREARRARRDQTFGAFKVAGLIARRARTINARHLHVHFAYSADPAIQAARLIGLGCTVTVHAWDIFHSSQAPLVRRRLERASGIVTISEFNVAHLRQVLPEVPIHHVPLGVAVGPPATLPPDGPVLSVARLVPKKGLDLLLAAMPEVLATAPGTRVEIIGDGPLREELERQADRLGVGEAVTFRGNVDSDQVQQALDGCSMFVLPCRIDQEGDQDGLPTVLIEALSRAVPVVTTDVVGISELVRNGETGVLVAPEDSRMLARGVLDLMDDPSRARRLGKSGRELVARSHAPEESARRLAAVFQKSSGTAA